jgi:hypothetical protein
VDAQVRHDVTHRRRIGGGGSSSGDGDGGSSGSIGGRGQRLGRPPEAVGEGSAVGLALNGAAGRGAAGGCLHNGGALVYITADRRTRVGWMAGRGPCGAAAL